MRKLVIVLGFFLFFPILQIEAKQNHTNISSNPSYVVSPNGSDDNPGTPEKPFATIQKAADVAKPGDIILIKAGRYQEQVVLKKSGEPGKPIIFTGERGADGSWLTVVNKGIPVVDWEPAPEVGLAVYKTTSIPFKPFCVTIEGKQLLRLSDRNMLLDKGKLLPEEELKKIKGADIRKNEGVGGFNLLRLPADAVVEYPNSREIPFWDAVEAAYGYIDGTTYIRFRNGDNPKDKNIIVSPQGTAFLINNVSNVVLKNFFISGAEMSIVIKGEKATDNIIEDSLIVNGRKRILITEKASRNIIQNNELTLNYYGYPGKPHPNIYREFKYTQGGSSSDDIGIDMRFAGSDNIIRYNRIYVGLMGLHMVAVPKAQVYKNIIRDMCSIGICTMSGVEDCFFFDNLIFNNAINLRIHHYNEPQRKPFMKRREYYYRNFFYNLEDAGTQVFIHYMPNWPRKFENPEEEPRIYFYHNTFSGGIAAFNLSGVSSSFMRETLLINNIFSFKLIRGAFIGTWRTWTVPEIFKSVDNNWIVMPEELIEKEKPAWFGENNIFSTSAYKWPKGRIFILTKDSPFLKKGLDLSNKFIIKGEEYSPLPGMEKGYFKGKKPDLGALQFGETIDKRFLQELKEVGVIPK